MAINRHFAEWRAPVALALALGVRLSRRLLALSAAASALLIAASALAENRVVLEARVSKVTSVGPEGTTSRELPDTEQEEIRIEIHDRKLIWVSRENKELHYSFGGITHMFVDPDSGSYVKVVDFREMEGIPRPGAQGKPARGAHCPGPRPTRSRRARQLGDVVSVLLSEAQSIRTAAPRRAGRGDEA
jgi:hypothetical protein